MSPRHRQKHKNPACECSAHTFLTMFESIGRMRLFAAGGGDEFPGVYGFPDLPTDKLPIQLLREETARWSRAFSSTHKLIREVGEGVKEAQHLDLTFEELEGVSEACIRALGAFARRINKLVA